MSRQQNQYADTLFSCTGLICVKYNSRRLPFKNIRPFGNETLLDIKIKALLELEFLDNVMIHTESQYIIDYVNKSYDTPKIILVKKDPIYASDTIDNREFCRNAVASVDSKYVLYSPVTMPFIQGGTYRNMYQKLCNGTGAWDSIILAADGKQGAGHKHEKHSICFGASLMTKHDVLEYGDFIGNVPYYMICSARERIDIDYPEEFNIALYHYFNPDAIYGTENAHSLRINPMYDLNKISSVGQLKIIPEHTSVGRDKVRHIKIIDVTVRDGGFDNQWNWKKKDVIEMLRCASDTGIEYFEIGYISNPDIPKPNDGHYRNISFETIDEIVDIVKPTCKISVMFDSWRYDVDRLPRNSKVDLIRIVTYMEDTKLLDAINQCRRVKEKGYCVSLNIMCASYFTTNILSHIMERVSANIECLDYLYFADSYGAMEPCDVRHIFQYASDIKILNPSLQLGFHIHNNGHIGMANMIASMDYVDIFDASWYGMGRGMGNVKLEDVVLFLSVKKQYPLMLEPFLRYIDSTCTPVSKSEIHNTLLGFLNIHPYRIKDYDQQMPLHNLYM